MEYILAQALEQSCKHVITCGYMHSNHCRVTAACCAQLGLKAHLFLRTNATEMVCSFFLTLFSYRLLIRN